MKVVNILEDLLVNSGDSRRDIVIVGEGNFTFSIALAALRGSSWNGILSTRVCKTQITRVVLESLDTRLDADIIGSNRFCGSYAVLSLDSIKLISISIEYCMSNASRFRNSQLLDSTTRTLSNIQTIKGLTITSS